MIEDNVEISEALSFFCSARKDIECEAVNTGQEGLDMIRAQNFDLILLDLAMPEFSGMDVLSFTETRRINKIKKYRYLYRFIKSRPTP